jgi:hypothetical protein
VNNNDEAKRIRDAARRCDMPIRIQTTFSNFRRVSPRVTKRIRAPTLGRTSSPCRTTPIRSGRPPRVTGCKMSTSSSRAD